ncbi:MAG: hypothetical protein HYX24_01000 [Candidatus Aenigmarchaeota archaeon]|nr:hypothetical protein [Candidatus Aenigmarchaeota archaeon]
MFEQIESLYGIERKVFKEMCVYMLGKELYVASREACDLANRLRYRNEGVGIMLGRSVMGRFKLTTNAIQLFGRYATKRVVEIDARQAIEFAAGGIIKTECKDEGYVIVRCGSDYLGCGYYRGNGEVESLVPKKRRLILQKDGGD